MNPNNQPSLYLDQAMSFEMVKNLCNGKGNAWSELGKFILIIGMDQFKLLFKAIVDKLIEDCKTFKLANLLSYVNPLEIIKWIYFKVRQYSSMITRNNEEHAHAYDKSIIQEPLNLLHIDINLQLSFWEYVSSDAFANQITYITSSIQNMTQKDNNTFQFQEEWSNIVITISDEVIMKILTPIKLTFEHKYAKRSIAKISTEMSSGAFIPIKSTDLTIIYNKNSYNGLKGQRKTFICVDKIIQDKIIVKKLKDIFDKERHCIEPIIDSWNSQKIFEKYIYVKAFYPHGDFSFDTVFRAFYYLYCLMKLITVYRVRSSQQNFKVVTAKNNLDLNSYESFLLGYPIISLSSIGMLSEINKDYSSSLISPAITLFNTFDTKYFGNYFYTSDNAPTNAYKQFISNLCYVSNLSSPYEGDIQDQVSETGKGSSITVQLYSNNPEVKLHKECLGFLSNVSKQVQLIQASDTKGDSVKTFDIRIEYKETTSQEKNPEYDRCKKRIEDLKTLPKSDVTEKLIAECIASTPDEFTNVVKFTKEVVCTSINEVHKSLDRLYLSKRDKHKLTSMLQDFRDDKETLKSLGLPNKLCVLLYGLPGCGKSSSIETICTFLQKDMYNLNLKSVRSNEDLGMLWDHVTNKTSGGGCIVIEDIDCQTNAVLARNENTVNEDLSGVLSPNETPLSLSYLLNILQGSLQRDNSVVVVTTNWIQKLDPAFTRSMRFDVKIDMKPADHDQIIEIYSVYFPKKTVPVELIKKIKEHTWTPAAFIDEFRQHIKNPDVSDEELFEVFMN